MNAVISGTIGRTLLIDGKSLKSFDIDDPSKLVVRQQSDLLYLFGEARDLRIIENSDIDSISRELEAESNLALALDLTLISLDEELEEDIRKDSLHDLNELLSEDQLSERLEGILYARPLPDDGDLAGALRLCDKSILPNSFALIEGLERRQSVIEKVSAAWDVIPSKVFGDHEQQSRFQRVAVQRRLFRSLVIALEDQSGIPTFLLNAGLDSAIQQLRNHRQVLQSWSVPFRTSTEAKTMKPDPEEAFEAKATPRRRHGRRVGLNRPAVLKEVNKRKGIISAAMRRHDLIIVKELVDDLVDFQRENGEIQHGAKSLCDLAIEAKELGLLDLRLELTKRSISIAPDDYWSWAQHGDALLSLQRLDEALAAYEHSEDFGAGVLARTGKGEVLKAQGEFKGALAAYDEVIRQHPENVVAKTGRAEVLKASNQLNDALAAYDEIRKRFPDNAIVRNGRSCTLEALGRYHEALEGLPDENPVGLEDWIGFHIRGMVLMRMKRIEEAVQIFQRGVTENPFPSSAAYFQAALAVALIRQEKYGDARNVLSDIDAPSLKPQIDVLRLHTSGEEEEFEEANAAFQDLTPKPWSISDELLDELHRRYILKAEPKRSNEWVFDKEVECLLLVANQQGSISSYTH